MVTKLRDLVGLGFVVVKTLRVKIIVTHRNRIKTGEPATDRPTDRPTASCTFLSIHTNLEEISTNTHTYWLPSSSSDKSDNMPVKMDEIRDGIIDSLKDVKPMDPWNSTRYSILKTMFAAAGKFNMKLPPCTLNMLKEISQNVDEPMLYRCATSYYLYMFDGNIMDLDQERIIKYLRYATEFYNSADSSERSRTINMSLEEKGKITTAGNELDQLKEVIDSALVYALDPRKYTKDLSKKFGKNENEMVEMLDAGFADCIEFSCAPEVNSSLIEEVRSLPEKDVAVYIYRDKDLPGDVIMDPMKVFRVFTVDLEKLQAFKMKNCFKYMKASISPEKHTSQKLIIGTFAAACLKPFAHAPRSRGETPFRPKSVYLQDNEEARHPQVKAFLTMMGCRDVDIAHKYIAVQFLLQVHATMEKSGKTMYDDIEGKSVPYLTAVSHGYTCMNCDKSHMDMKQCECRKAYFCSKECQSAKWAEHKKEHKKAMHKLSKKEKK